MASRRTLSSKTRLATLPESALRQLILLALDEVPALEAWLEPHLSNQAALSPPSKPSSTFDAVRWRSEIRRVLSLIDPHDWKRSAGADDLLAPLVERATTVLEQCDAGTALSMLEVLCDEVVPDYEQYEGETELSECLERIGETMARAVRTAPRVEEAQQALGQKIRRWQEHLALYGVDAPFSTAAQALASKTAAPGARKKSTRRPSAR